MTLILVVDDEPLVRELLTTLLQREGYETIEASTGLEAIAQLDAHDPALVLSDVAMPDMNGFELLAHLRAGRGSDVPFVIVSSHDDPDSVAAAIYAGANEYLVKPFRPERVREVVESALVS